MSTSFNIYEYNLGGIFLSCIEADFCNCRLILQLWFLKEIYKMCAPLHRSKLQSLAKTKAILSSTFCTRTGYCKNVGGRVNRVGAHRPCWLTHRKDLQSDQDRPGGSRRACISVLWSLWRPPPRRQSWRPRRRRSPRRSWKRLRFFLLRVRTDFVLTLTSFLIVSNSWKIIFWQIDDFRCEISGSLRIYFSI